ncbi:MAG: class I SAM-dependent methyltransferase [Promethearchaeota archaeon]
MLSKIDYKMMAFFFKIRDYFKNPYKIMESIFSDIKRYKSKEILQIGHVEKIKKNLIFEDIKNFRILDYGCGPGSFSIAAAEYIQDIGGAPIIYAIDINKYAIKSLDKKIKKKHLEEQIVTILSEPNKTNINLESDSIDLAILFDVFHEINQKATVLNEIKRVLKVGGILAYDDHHLGVEGEKYLLNFDFEKIIINKEDRNRKDANFKYKLFKNLNN